MDKPNGLTQIVEGNLRAKLDEILTRLSRIEANLATPDQDEILTKKQCAKLLDVSPSTIDNWRARRGMPATMIGNRVYFRKSVVIAWMFKKKLI